MEVAAERLQREDPSKNEGAMREVSEHNHLVNPGVVETKLWSR